MSPAPRLGIARAVPGRAGSQLRLRARFRLSTLLRYAQCVTPSDSLAEHADALSEVLSHATLGNCLDIARRLVALAQQRELPEPPTYEVQPLRFDKTPHTRGERRDLRLVIPLRPETKQRLGFEPDEIIPLWPYHVTTEFSARALVDALTGHRGHPIESYLETFFLHPEFFRLSEYDVKQEGEPV